jgi:hypothetical protein
LTGPGERHKLKPMGTHKISSGYYAIDTEPGRATDEDKSNTQRVFDRVFSSPILVQRSRGDVGKSTVKESSAPILSKNDSDK